MESEEINLRTPSIANNNHHNRNAELELRKVNEVTGNFIIEKYQRGFRWTDDEVNALLNDIYTSNGKKYCLQPLVLKQVSDNTYEVLDGQQRLTTIYLIYRFMARLSPNLLHNNYTIEYVTRPPIPEILTIEDRLKNIDFLHLYDAEQTIIKWFGDDKAQLGPKCMKLIDYFATTIEFIWYVLPSDTIDTREANEIFRRHNIGKIQLNNAELVRALFLSRDTKDQLTIERQKEIGIQWDQLEHKLHNQRFWGFLTNKEESSYASRIELIFDMMARKPDGSREKHFTFIFFHEKLKTQTIKNVWEEVIHYFQLLEDWFTDHDLYHLLGFIISTGVKPLEDIVKDVTDNKKTKSTVRNEYLPSIIIDELDLTRDQALTLNYIQNKYKIEMLMLLFNIESIRLLPAKEERFPFYLYKKENWSLEHIHAQNSQGLNTQDNWRDWLRLHKKTLEDFIWSSNDAHIQSEISLLIEQINNQIQNITYQQFIDLFQRMIKFFTNDTDSSYLDMIQNLTLLDCSTNSSISNYTFDVKRRLIMQKDNDNHFVPLCTKRVFAKYYSHENDKSDLHFWTETDRNAYINHILGDGKQCGILTNYLKNDNSNGTN